MKFILHEHVYNKKILKTKCSLYKIHINLVNLNLISEYTLLEAFTLSGILYIFTLPQIAAFSNRILK